MKKKPLIIWIVCSFLLCCLLGKELYCGSTLKFPLYKELELLADVFTIVEKSYVKEVSIKDLIHGALRGIMDTLDAHSQFLGEEEYKEMKIETKGKFGGLGIEITLKDKILTIVAPLHDTPAFKAGLKSGDRIVKIDGESTKNITLNESVKKLRGDPGTEINLTILRENKKEFMEFTIKRAFIKLESVVDTSIIAEGIGYSHIIQFQERTAEDLEEALKSLKPESLEGFILDLRNNPGGLLQDAVEVSELFIPAPKMIVTTKGRLSDQNQEYPSENDKALVDVPLIILINEGSASGSEIVAGAIKDWNRGKLVGIKTFGKGSVQSVLPLRDGSALKLTTALYYTPEGTNINEVGISPDIEINITEEQELKLWKAKAKKEKIDLLSLDPQLKGAVNILKGLPIDKQKQETEIEEKTNTET